MGIGNIAICRPVGGLNIMPQQQYTTATMNMLVHRSLNVSEQQLLLTLVKRLNQRLCSGTLVSLGNFEARFIIGKNR